MNKFTLAAVSLIGAIPGGYFAYMMVMAMLNYFKDMNGMMRVIACVALAMSALMTVMPIGIVIFSTKPKTDDEEETESKSEADEPAEELDEVEPSAVDMELDSFDDDDGLPATKLGASGDAESEESVVIDTEGMFDDDIYEADDDLEEVEEAPKKKKKDKKKKKK